MDERRVTDRFVGNPTEESFADLFGLLSPQLVAFFRARKCAYAEDLAQEVMFIVYRKVDQVRDRALFRSWLFKIARNVLYRHFAKQSHEVNTVELSEVPDRFVATPALGAGHAFEFNRWMEFLNSAERDALVLRFIEGCEFHEIAAAQGAPVGTVQWRVFHAKRKLTRHLKLREKAAAKAA